MDELWGKVVPVPEANLRPFRGGERLPGGVRVIYTPGHASHHVTYLADGVAYVGDVAGVRIPPAELVLMPTPPPEIDVELWEESIDRVAAGRPRSLALTHFGATDDVAGHLARARAALRESMSLASERDRDGFVRAMRERVAAAVPAAEAERFEQVAPFEQLHMGLERYLRNR
jgi:glyoxylase-like metal-dependent hydrolase (beta-lactamase superfamily II)